MDIETDDAVYLTDDYYNEFDYGYEIEAVSTKVFD